MCAAISKAPSRFREVSPHSDGDGCADPPGWRLADRGRTAARPARTRHDTAAIGRRADHCGDNHNHAPNNHPPSNDAVSRRQHDVDTGGHSFTHHRTSSWSEGHRHDCRNHDCRNHHCRNHHDHNHNNPNVDAPNIDDNGATDTLHWAFNDPSVPHGYNHNCHNSHNSHNNDFIHDHYNTSANSGRAHRRQAEQACRGTETPDEAAGSAHQRNRIPDGERNTALGRRP
jgi:hypothetical protein